MQKKHFAVIVTIMICAIFFLSSQALAKTKILKFAYPAPAKSDMGAAFEWWAKEVTKRSNGQVKVETYPMQSLVKAPQALDAVKFGVAEMSMIDVLLALKRFPASSVFSLPTVAFPSTPAGSVAGGAAFLEMSKKYKSFQKEFKEFKLVMCIGFVGQSFVAKKPLQVPNDLKGMKIGATGIAARYVESCGGVPVKISPPEAYMSMERGVIDSVLSNWVIILSRQLFEVAKDKYEYNVSQFPMPVFMNLKTWNSLPDDVKKIIDELAPQVLRVRAGITAKITGIAKKKWAGAGNTVGMPTPEQISLWEAKGKVFEEDWLKKMKAQGIDDAPAILAELKQRRAAVMK
jgi:TRAP-type transport system periplasmic protein